eukprot:COSAG01_NODE_616_length_14815_cov_8.518076_6_plen_147_part_00
MLEGWPPFLRLAPQAISGKPSPANAKHAPAVDLAARVRDALITYFTHPPHANSRICCGCTYHLCPASFSSRCGGSGGGSGGGGGDIRDGGGGIHHLRCYLSARGLMLVPPSYPADPSGTKPVRPHGLLEPFPDAGAHGRTCGVSGG